MGFSLACFRVLSVSWLLAAQIIRPEQVPVGASEEIAVYYENGQAYKFLRGRYRITQTDSGRCITGDGLGTVALALLVVGILAMIGAAWVWTAICPIMYIM